MTWFNCGCTEGEDEESTATVYSVVDIIWDTEEIVNVEEQWIKAIIYIRSTNCLENSICYIP